jgi:hypothetical protein
MADTTPADGYYAEDDMGKDELDLSFLDDDSDDTSEAEKSDKK